MNWKLYGKYARMLFLIHLIFSSEVAGKTEFYTPVSKYSNKVAKSGALFNTTKKETPTSGACAFQCSTMEACQSFVFGPNGCLGYSKFTDHTATISTADMKHYDNQGPVGNVAVGKPTGESTYYTWAGMKLKAWRAVEGNRKATISNSQAFCFASNPSQTKNAYMYVNLKYTYFIQSISILLRKGMAKYASEFKDVSIKVGQTLSDVKQCAYVENEAKGLQGRFINLDCNKSGQFVKVVQKSGVLRFCEIEIYGYKMY